MLYFCFVAKTNCMDSVSITFILAAYIHPDADSKDALYVCVYFYKINCLRYQDREKNGIEHF